MVGQDLGLTLDFENWYRRVLTRGVRITTNVAPLAVDDGSVTAVHAYSGQTLKFGPFDTIVIANHGRANDALYFALKGTVEVHRAGDCVAPRRASNAIGEGHRLGRML
jgi:2,4-dienoyl-CoA reductase (NADPH2)